MVFRGIEGTAISKESQYHHSLDIVITADPTTVHIYEQIKEYLCSSKSFKVKAAPT